MAILLGIATAVFAWQGIASVSARPTAHLEVVVEGDQPLNISQRTVDAVMADAVSTWAPLRVRVVDRLLSSDELNGRVDFGADVILSTALMKDTGASNSSPYQFTGAGIYSSGQNTDRLRESRFAIAAAFTTNVGLGHGPQAVAAAALRAVDVVDDRPVTNPLFWLAGTALGLSLSIAALTISLSRRKRREQLHRRFTTARSSFAGVVLGLQALEVSHEATPPEKRTLNFTQSWHTIRDASLELSRTEQATIDAVSAPRRALTTATAQMVNDFAAEARRLSTLAQALMDSGAVLAGHAGSQSVLDKLTAPAALAGGELLARLAVRPAELELDQEVRRVEAALQSLLRAASARRAEGAALQAWADAEHALDAGVRAVINSLRRQRKLPRMPKTTRTAEFADLRRGLNLPSRGTLRLLTALDEANAVMFAITGPLAGIPDAPALKALSEPWPVALVRTVSRVPRKVLWSSLGCALALVSLSASGIIVAQLPHEPGWELKGNQPLASLTIDGNVHELSEEGIRKHLKSNFAPGFQVILAVRDAEKYLGEAVSGLPQDSLATGPVDPQVLVDALWRIKSEFPQLVDAQTEELKDGAAIIPVLTLDGGRYITAPAVTGAVSLGAGSRLGDIFWLNSSLGISPYGSVQVSNAVEDVARGLQNGPYVEPEVSLTAVYWLLALSIGLGLTALGIALRYGGIMSLRLGRFGRTSSELRAARTNLVTLTLGLDDSRINSLAVLGTGDKADPEATDQRIFESSLAVAWRMVDELAAQPLSARLNDGYAARIVEFRRLVDVLTLRDNDVARRTRMLLELAFTPGRMSGS